MARGKLITVSGPTGSGKSTLMRHALARFPELLSPKSYTTRPPRDASVENAHYVFLSTREFEEKIKEGAFLEWAKFGGNYYGTLRAEVMQGLAAGKIMFKEMEVQGVRQVKKFFSQENLVTVFVDAGSWEESKTRALAREAMSDDVLEKRQAHFQDEMTFEPEADVIIYNLTGRYREAEDAFEAVIAKALEESEI